MSPIKIEVPVELYGTLKDFISDKVVNKENEEKQYYIGPERLTELREIMEYMDKQSTIKTIIHTDGTPMEVCVIPRAVETYFEAKGGVWSQEPGLIGMKINNSLYKIAYKELKMLGMGYSSSAGLGSALWIELRSAPLFERLLEEWARPAVTNLEKKKEVRERIEKIHIDINALSEQVDIQGVRNELEKIPVPDYVYDDNRKYFVPIFQLFNMVLKDLGIPFLQPMRRYSSTWYWYSEYRDWCDYDYDVAIEKTKGTRHPYDRIEAGKKTSDEERSKKVSGAIRVLDRAIGDAAPQIEVSLPGPEKLPRLTQKIDEEAGDEEEDKEEEEPKEQ